MVRWRTLYQLQAIVTCYVYTPSTVIEHVCERISEGNKETVWFECVLFSVSRNMLIEWIGQHLPVQPFSPLVDVSIYTIHHSVCPSAKWCSGHYSRTVCFSRRGCVLNQLTAAVLMNCKLGTEDFFFSTYIKIQLYTAWLQVPLLSWTKTSLIASLTHHKTLHFFFLELSSNFGCIKQVKPLNYGRTDTILTLGIGSILCSHTRTRKYSLMPHIGITLLH